MILDEIVASTRDSVAQRKREIPAEALRARIADQSPPLDMLAYISRPGVSVIAEIKRASPSKGPLNLTLEPDVLARRYALAGADAISVLTEPYRFRGALQDLALARAGLSEARMDLPLLRKDFIIDPYQVLEARAWGADALLLIVAALDDRSLGELMMRAQELGLTPLVEVHNRKDLLRAIPFSPPLIGINNRNLKTFEVDLETTRSLRDLVPEGCVLVSESGIHEPAHMGALAAMKVDAALIGEALVTAEDPRARLQALKAGGR